MTDFVFIDSGVGGIPYMTSLLKRSSQASCLYVADTANFPYGEKSHEEVVTAASSLVEKICKRFAPSVIIVACNTISVNALDFLRQTFPQVKFVGTVPAIKLAASVSQKRKIGLLATKATCENPYNIELKNNFASDCQLICRPDASLVSFIEHKAFTSEPSELLQAVEPAISFFRKEGCDVIILGCTHFLNIKDIFIEACGQDIKIVDSVDGVVRHAIEVYGKNLNGNKASHELYVTSLSDKDEALQYDVLCKRFEIDFAGKL